MSDVRTAIQREIDHVEPRPYSLEIFQKRRRKTMRRHRIGTVALGIVVGAVALAPLIVALRAHQHAGAPAAVPITRSNVSRLGPYWSSYTGDSINSAPTIADGRVYVANVGGTLSAYPLTCAQAPGTCAPIWTAKDGPASEFGVGGPAVGDGMVFVGNLEGTLLGYPTSCGPGTCAPTWRAIVGGDLSEATPAVADGVVYVGSTSGTISAFSVGCTSFPHPCLPLWAARLHGGFAVNGSAGAGPTVAGGVVYVGSTGGTLYTFPTSCGAGTTCTPIHTVTLAGILNNPIVVRDDVVYVTSGPSLYAFPVHCLDDAVGCGPTWVGHTKSLIVGAPAVGDGYAYVGSDDRSLSAFHLPCSGCSGGGQPSWTIPHLGRFPNPAVYGGVVYVARMAYTNTLKAFAVDCGVSGQACEPLLSYVTDGFVQQQVIADGNGTIFAATGDPTGGLGGGDIYAFRVGGHAPGPKHQVTAARGVAHAPTPGSAAYSWLYPLFYLCAAALALFWAARRRNARRVSDPSPDDA